MAIEVFNRHENKYILDIEIFRKLQSRLLDYMEPDEYNRQHENYTITNLYYDTNDNYLIRRSLSKPRYKEKLRLRAYGVPTENSKVYIEIKKKFRGIVNKRRSALSLNDAYEFAETGVLPNEQPYQNRQVLKEVEYIFKIHKLYPTLYLAYDRCAYFGIEQSSLRVSFDRNIRSRRYDLRLEAGDYGEFLIRENLCLMEIKTAYGIPKWLCGMLSEYKLYPVSFSKYGTEYMKTLKNNRPQGIYNFDSGKTISALEKTIDISAKQSINL